MFIMNEWRRGGLYWLARLTPDVAIWVRALAGEFSLCLWARQFLLAVPLPTDLLGRLKKCLVRTWDGLVSHPERRNAPSRVKETRRKPR